MPEVQTSHGTQPPTSPKGHPLPRRTSPEHSVTLLHHRLARNASEKPASSRAAAATSSGSSSSPRQQSSGESHNTGPSDPKKWFDQNNENPSAEYSHAMDVDPPFFQKESDSSNEDMVKPTSYPQHLLKPPVTGTMKPSATHSSSADDYRSVIDDLTVEIKRLKDELKRYKQKGPEMLRRDKLFEIKVHGLPKRKKRELESTLCDFASGLESSTPSAEPSSARKKSRHMSRLDSGSRSISKHASSSSGSHSRPVDSAYASMSTAANSSGTSLARSSAISRARSSEQKVQNYLKDIPEGLYPRHMVMTDKDKKKLIVRRLEQIFTGRITGRNLTRHQPKSAAYIAPMAPIMVEPSTGNTTINHGPPLNMSMAQNEPSREARILASEGKKSQTKDTNSATNSNEQPDSGGNSATIEVSTSPPDAPPPEQRPTRPRDLDPDRLQNPTENMDYIRHLGLAPPHLTALATHDDVAPDADGWVYLNLLCNMAQLHMLNVAPDYIRSAVSEKSTKFQLSQDGRKIRWRGGTEGTKFSSDSSGDTSQMSRSDESEGVEEDGARKKRKTLQTSKSGQFSSSTKNTSDRSKMDHMSSADSFHYKPLFIHQSFSAEQTSLDDTGSSFGAAEDNSNGESRWGETGSGSYRRKRKRLDGVIIYYSGAPFCTDLSGDPGDASPSSYLTSDGHEQQLSTGADFLRPEPPHRTASGSALPYRPLSDGTTGPSRDVDIDSGSDDAPIDIEASFPWSNATQSMPRSTLDASGLGGVIPDDHFMVLATTKRPKKDAATITYQLQADDVPGLIKKIGTPMNSTSKGLSQSQLKRKLSSRINIQYTSKAVKKLDPAPLPPPGMYYAFDSDSDDSDESECESDLDDESRAPVVNRAFLHVFEDTYPDDEEMTSGDEEGEEPDDGDEPGEDVEDAISEQIRIPVPQAGLRRASRSAVAAAGTARSRSKSLSAELPLATGSSVATAGGAESGYSSGREESG